MQALQSASINGKQLGLIVDFTSLAADASGLGSVGHQVQHEVQASNAQVFGIRGAGCCGFHVALSLAQSFFCSNPNLEFALLVAADRANDSGRMCLPVSIMADAATAMVLARPGRASQRMGCVRAVMTQTSGRFSEVITADPETHHVNIDSATFESQIVPLHFVVLNRLLERTLKAADISRADIGAIVYPNTTLLDRASVARALGFDQRLLIGPGPRNLGHAFANDLLINAQPLFEPKSEVSRVHSAWLAAGSGFTWGAAIIDATRQ
jgi:3-oxoacyl-[acyl-carrier-protein] synthase III